MSEVIYQVTVKTSSQKASERFVEWMKTEHVKDLLAIDGCSDCRVSTEDRLTYVCEYLFESQNALDLYYSNHADRLRDKAAGRFLKGELEISRRELSLVLRENP